MSDSYSYRHPVRKEHTRNFTSRLPERLRDAMTKVFISEDPSQIAALRRVSGLTDTKLRTVFNTGHGDRTALRNLREYLFGRDRNNFTPDPA